MNSHRTVKPKFHQIALGGAVLILILAIGLAAQQTAKILDPADILRIKTCSRAEISPDGRWIAYTVSVPRESEEPSGSSYSELYVASFVTGEVRPFITGKVNVSSLRWSPDSARIGFLMARGEKALTQVWTIPAAGGEAVPATSSPTAVLDFNWHPFGDRIAYIAMTPAGKREEELEKKGFGFIFYEENLKHRNLYGTSLEPGSKPEQLTDGVTIWSFEFSPDGKTIAAAVSPRNMVDDSYMFQRIHILDLATKTLTKVSDNPGKLGNFVFSPDGGRIVYAAAFDRKDHAVSQAFLIPARGGPALNLTPPKFRGHISWVGWKDDKTVVYLAGEGVWPTLSEVPAAGGERKVVLNGQETGLIFGTPSYTADFKAFAFTANTSQIPGDLYAWEPGKEMRRLTTLNPWLSERQFGKQDIYRYKARDGWDVEGLLIHPVKYESGKRYPLVVFVHGGPESHYSNGWVTRYAEPGQTLAGKGYLVFYPNYRASTGYGLKFAAAGYRDAAGKEFDDIADGIESLIKAGLADKDKVGLAGGSYGGFAAAWFSSYYTRLVKAVAMFVGISDLVSKRLTTDIPYEELYVHSGQPLEKMWDQNRKRSPIFWAHQSKTAVLILGGAADTRVHPSQSFEYYRALKMNDHPAVRLVQYPGEGHGNARQPGRIDVLHRQLQWFDWYLMEGKPVSGPMPPLDISSGYGLSLKD